VATTSAAAIEPILASPASPPPPSVVVLAGASGDLARRKVIPAMFELHRQGRLPGQFDLVALTRGGDPATFLAELEDGVARLGKVDTASDAWQSFRARIQVRAVDLADPADVRALGTALDGLDR